MAENLGSLPNKTYIPTTTYTVPTTGTETSTVDVTTLEATQAAEEQSGVWAGRKQNNKYVPGLDPDTAQQDPTAVASSEMNGYLRQAGVPTTMNSARARQSEAQYASSPQLAAQVDNLTGAFKSMAANPNDPTVQARGMAAVQKTTDFWAEAAKQGAQIDPWSLLLLAMRNSVRDQNETMKYDLNKLQMYSTMQQQLSQYGRVIEDAQRRIDDDQNAHPGKDRSKNPVAFEDRRSYNLSFSTLDANGNLPYAQEAQQNDGAVTKARDLSTTRQTSANSWEFSTPDGSKKYTGYGPDEEAARNDAFGRIPNNPKSGGSNTITATGLNIQLQLYTQSMDALNKHIQKWQNQYQSDSDAKNQMVAQITSILKNMYDMQSSITRNLAM